jgi:TetR/AcrR family transcriptional regulator, transcriptional repressor for nem operon
MKSKGERTKERILEKTSPLFNTRGYYTAAVSEIMAVTGLKKGGLYNHFSSKEEMALEAFKYNLSIMKRVFSNAINSTDGYRGKLKALVSESRNVALGKYIAGGCAILNASVESDDCYPPLRKAAEKGANNLMKMIFNLLENGRQAGEFRNLSEKEVDSLSKFFLASMEGGIMLTKLTDSVEPINSVISYLFVMIDQL